MEEALNEARDYGISEKCELIQNKIVKETDLYYVVYHEYISHRGHGDYGLHDMIYFGKKTISINKFTGKYTTKYETIRTAEGKYNENPNVLRY